jgi:hypothetical protein
MGFTAQKIRLGTVQADGTDRKSLTIDWPKSEEPPLVYTIDGKSILYAAGNTFVDQPLDGKAPTITTFPDHRTAWIRDVYFEPRQVLLELSDWPEGQTMDLVEIDLDDRGQVDLAVDVRKAGLEVSADRQHRFLWAVMPDSSFRLVVEPGTSGERVVETAIDDEVPCCELALPAVWLEDGRLVYETRVDGGRVVLRREYADGSEPNEIALPAGITPGFYYGIDPAGFVRGFKNRTGGGHSDVLIDLNTGRVGAEASGADDGTWIAPGGRLVYQQGSDLHVTDMDGNDRIIARDVEAVLGSNLY